MKRWMLALVVAGIGSVTCAQAASYGYGSCCDPCCDPCCQPCNPCCDPCCDPCWDPCCDPCWCGGFEVIGEYLYIRPHQCDLNYVIVDEQSFGDVSGTDLGPLDLFLPSGKQLGITPDYESAFRVGLGYLFNCGCNDITVTYTRLCTTDRSKVAVPNAEGGLWITCAHPRYADRRLNNGTVTNGVANLDPALTPIERANAQANTRIEYNMVDGVVGARSMKGCDLWIRGFIGLRWADICVRKDANYEGVTSEDFVDAGSILARVVYNEFAHVHSRSDAWGIGPRVGIDLRYALSCGLGLGAHAGASILVGENCHNQRQRFQEFSLIGTGGPTINPLDESLDVRNNSRCHLFPEWDARLGINYLFCCGDCFSALIEVGWEFVSYINALGRIRFNDFAGTNREVCESFNIDGLYVSVKVSI